MGRQNDPESDRDHYKRSRTPPVLTERRPTVIALASDPEQTERHEHRPSDVTQTEHRAELSSAE